jgi:hypothetical protein
MVYWYEVVAKLRKKNPCLMNVLNFTVVVKCTNHCVINVDEVTKVKLIQYEIENVSKELFI